tara:strand:+ start:20359 stop:20985 length:627 start_codon:yes stop_codon:yes gene_type:complete
MFYFHKIPSFIQKVYNQRQWQVNAEDKSLFLTFDDGPHPSLTPKILDLLSKFRAKVTFFQLGSKIEAYPSLHRRCLDEGHAVGNHGYYHLDSVKTPLKEFINNIEYGALTSNSTLYRPAFGRLPLRRKKEILNKYNVVMWDIMPGDFDIKQDTKSCVKVLKNNVTRGSIIVLHENERAKDKVIDILEWVLKKYSKEGYQFCGLDPYHI